MSQPGVGGKPNSLLIVDDSSVQRDHAVRLCRAHGVPLIYEAVSGFEALELLDILAISPALIMVDLEMPGMDGIELIQQLHRRGVRLPLIVCSSRERALIQSVEIMARNLGMSAVAGVQKPLTPEALEVAFGAVLSAQARESATGLVDEGGAQALNAQSLASAIEAGHISVHYQPKVDMRTGIVRGVEALARWQLEDGAFVRPDRFIPLAEQCGLIHDLTRAVMHRALAQATEWNARGLRLSMAINLSQSLFDGHEVVGEIVGMVNEYALQPDQLVFEITESTVADRIGIALGSLARLRLKGFGLSIDDYGTGFSSMQQLARIPFTELKIDRSFVHEAHHRSDLGVILQSALDMGHRLGLVTVAEGIESMKDWRFLQQSGCSVGQGYLIGKPMPPSELPAWLKRHQLRLPELKSQGPN